MLRTATGKSNNSGAPYTFLHDTQWNGNRTVNLIKNASGFWRSRPAWENNDTSVDQETYNLNFGEHGEAIGDTKSDTTSYPSGHTGYLWNTAYCYAAIGGLSSSAVVNLFARAYQYSESRVIVGAHW
jgi:membrane-associated phospholipid phosphatase